MSDLFNWDSLNVTTEDTDSLVSDVQGVQNILNTQSASLTQEQQEVKDAMAAEAESANAIAQQDAQLANLLLDERLQRDQQLSQQWKELDEIADPIEHARKVQRGVEELQEATEAYNKDSQEANSLNPLVGIPATFRSMFSKEAMEGAARNVKLQMDGFNEIQNIRAAALSNYQTRAQLYTQERVDAEKELNTMKAAHTALTNKKALEAKDLDFLMQRYNIEESKRDGIIKTLNAKMQGKQLQLASVQAQIEATMMPYRLEQMQLATAEMRDNTNRRKSIEAQFALKYPDQELRPNWWTPQVQGSMSSREIARLQEVVTSSQYGVNDNSFTAANIAAQAGNNQQAVEYIAMAEQLRDQYNEEALRQATAENPLAAKTFEPPLNPKDPNYAAKMDVFMRNQQTITEEVDGNLAVRNGYVVMESFQHLKQNGELDLDAAVRSNIITPKVKDLLETGDFDLIITGEGAGKQATTALNQLFEAAAAKEKDGVTYTSSELARAFTFWSQLALERSNASPNTAMNVSKVTLTGVDAFSTKTGLFERYETTHKPLDVTDINQVMARFDALFKRRTKYKQGKTELDVNYASRTAGASAAEVEQRAVQSYSPYGWMSFQ